MRLPLVLLGLPLLALQAHAQTVPSPHVVSPPPIAAPASAAPNAIGSATPQHHRMTWKQHFAEANLAHDGHLTLQEANGGYPTMARHFTEIDASKKGYVTEEDITNWRKQQHAMRHSDSTGQGFRARHALQQGVTTPDASTMGQPTTTQ